VAAEIGDVEITKLLIKHGASVNIRQYSLSKRSLGSAISERPLMVSRRLPIYWAVTKRQSAVVKLLLEYGANPNARTTAGRSVLQEACFMNDPTSVRILLEAGADIDGTNLGSVCYI
jgi:ankyrin repeat protein